MRAVTWHGRRDVRVDTVPDPAIEHPTDAIVRVTSTGICGSDLHLYEVMGPFMKEGDVLGHEPMGVVEAVGAEVTQIAPGDRVVIPFNISCGHCFMCDHGLQSQCETTQVRGQGTGAALFGYTKLYGQVPGGQAELLRVPFGNTLPIKVPEGPPDDRFVFLSDVLPTAWQGVMYANVGPDDTLLVMGLGPIGDMAARIARHLGVEKVIGIDRVAERLELASRYGVETVDLEAHDDVSEAIREMTDGRHRADDLDRDLRFGPAPARHARHVHRRGRRARARADGDRGGGRFAGDPHPAGRPGGGPVQHLLRQLLDVRARPLLAM